MFTLEALASECDVSPRQIVRWLRRGVISASGGRSRGGNFTYDHVRQVMEVKRTLDNRVTLTDLAERRRWKDDPDA